MKKVLLLMVAVLFVSSVAMADHISVYQDAAGQDCELDAPPGQFNAPHVVHKLTAGTTGSRFKVQFPAGTNFFGFNTPYTPVGNIQTDISIGYGVCLVGSNPIGQINATWGAGAIQVLAADLQPVIIVTGCEAIEYPATGGTACVGSPCPCEPNATERSTWGQVKALFH
jgi:hypothetical protein